MTVEKKTFNPYSWQDLSEYRSEIYGISIIWIMLFHSYLCKVTVTGNLPGLDWLGVLLKFGNMGCEVFLLLSGISLFFSFSKDQRLGAFWLKRIKRLFWPVVILDGIPWIIDLATGVSTIKQTILSFALVRFWVDGHQQIWFISCILVCYLLYPLFYYFFFKKEKGSFVKLVIVLAIVVALLYMCREFSPEFYKRTAIALCRFPIFIIGCWLGKWVKENHQSIFWILPVSILLCLFGFSLLNRRVLTSLELRLAYVIPAIAITIVFSFVSKHLLLRIIRKLLIGAGKISLELYIAHILFINFYRDNELFYAYEEGDILKYITTLVLAVGAAVAGYYIRTYIEKALRKKNNHKELL